MLLLLSSVLIGERNFFRPMSLSFQRSNLKSENNLHSGGFSGSMVGSTTLSFYKDVVFRPRLNTLIFLPILG